MKNRKVLVTGCAGFLATWLCEGLIERGAAVAGVDRAWPARSRIHKLSSQIELHSGDLVDFETAARLLRENGFDFIFHLAAQALVGEAARNPRATFRDNIEGTWNVLEAARLERHRTGRPLGVVVASSDKAYGPQERLPYTEDAAMSGCYPYDVSKSCADLIARSYFHSYALPVAVVRCGNLYGGGDLNWSRLIPGTVRHVLAGERPVIRSDGTPIRDYVYVRDASEAILLISEQMIAGARFGGEAFNVSSESHASVLEVVGKILEITGKPELKPIVQGEAALEIAEQYLDCRKIRETVGWQARWDLDAGLSETVTWYREFFRESP